jgi:hypothetical protein
MPDSAQERKTGISPLACRTQNEVASCQATVSEARRFGNVLDRSIVVSQTAYMKTFPLFLVLLCLIIIGPKAKAVSPPPDATGTYNTAVGWFSLQSNLTGNFNTAIGAETLFANTADNNTVTGTGDFSITLPVRITRPLECSPFLTTPAALARHHSFRFASSNGMTRSTLPVESKIRTSPDRSKNPHCFNPRKLPDFPLQKKFT